MAVLIPAMREKGRPPNHHALAELADRQYGVVSIRQLTEELGYSHSAVERASKAGRLHRVHRGVYAVGHTRLSAHGECLSAVLACGPGALLSHYSAGWLWGLMKTSPLPVHITTPITRKPRLPVWIHRSRCLMEDDRALEQEIPVTSVPRTLLDLAAAVRFHRLQRMLERSEELKQFDLGPVESLLDRTRGHHGWGPLRRAIALYQPVPFSRSEFERCFFAAVVRAVYWPEYRFAVELDVYATHGAKGAFERDRLRQEDLKLAGIELTRVTDVRFHREPEAVLARVVRLLEQRRRGLALRVATELAG